MLYTIYKIYSDNCDFVYVGSTRAYANRKCQHKRCCNTENEPPYNYKVYTTIRLNGGWDSFKMVPIEEIEFDTKLQAHIREQQWMDRLNSNLNMRNCTFNKEEYDKEYHNANREHINEQKKGWRAANPEYNREYQAANRDRINANQRENYKKRKEASQIKNE